MRPPLIKFNVLLAESSGSFTFANASILAPVARGACHRRSLGRRVCVPLKEYPRALLVRAHFLLGPEGSINESVELVVRPNQRRVHRERTVVLG